MSFRQSAKDITSKGLTSDKATSLADLHRRRSESQSQYFTPRWVALGIWQSLSPIVAQARSKDRLLSVADTSCGNGRLFEGAPLDCASLYGLDNDLRCIEALIQDSDDSDIDHHFEHGCLSELQMKNMDIATLNPPFSIQLESPNLLHFDTNSFGRFGPGTAARSHEYALAHALSGANVVAAILPVAMNTLARSYRRLHSVVYLPKNTFFNEGANVETAVYFFNHIACKGVNEYHVQEEDDWPALDLSVGSFRLTPKFKLSSFDASEPTITLPVTGNPRVELHQHNRRVTLKFFCGLTQAKVLNGLYQARAEGKRLPRSIQFAGQTRLLLDVMLLQEDPDGQLDNLADVINQLGGAAWIAPTLKNYYAKLIKRYRRDCTPMYRMVKQASDDRVTLTAKRRTLLDPNDFNSPSIRKGETLQASLVKGEYQVTVDDHSVRLRRDCVAKRFEIDQSEAPNEWRLLHPGLNHHFPELAKMHRARVKRAGIDWLSSFQRDSLTEGLINSAGYIGGWEQGTGKARYAIALALCHSGKNLICVESGLLPEMLREVDKLNIPASQW